LRPTGAIPKRNKVEQRNEGESRNPEKPDPENVYKTFSGFRPNKKL